MGRHAAPGDSEPEVALQAPVPRFVPTVTVAPQAAPRPVVAPTGFADAVESLRPPPTRPQPVPGGRHSVPDDDDDEPDAIEAAYLEVSAAQTDRLPQPGAKPEAVQRPPRTRKPVQRPPRTRKQGGTAADLHLLRTDPALRNRVIAAVLVPFVLFFLVLLIIGRLDAAAVWIWLPLISAGLGAGRLLDTGHARSTAAAETVEVSAER